MGRPTPTGQATRQQHRCDELIGFRADLATCFTRWGDALFELCDAALCAPGAGRLGALPQLGAGVPPQPRQPLQGARRGRIDEDALRRLLVEHRPSDWPLVFAVDASTWDRCDAECSPERGFYYSASKHSAGQPIVAGWCYQWICQLDWAPDSWTAPLDVVRITPDDGRHHGHHRPGPPPRRPPARRREVPLFVFDAGYDPIAIGHDLADACRGALSHPRRPGLLRRSPPHPNRPAGTGGRPPRHGERFEVLRPEDLAEPDARLTATDPRYGTVNVRAWHGCIPGCRSRTLGRTTRRRRSCAAA